MNLIIKCDQHSVSEPASLKGIPVDSFTFFNSPGVHLDLGRLLGLQSDGPDAGPVPQQAEPGTQAAWPPRRSTPDCPPCSKPAPPLWRQRDCLTQHTIQPAPAF